MAASETRKLGFAVGALVGFGALMVWVLTGSSTIGREEPAHEITETTADTPSEPKEPEAAPSKRADSPPVAPSAPAQPGVDLFAGTMPDFMAAAHIRVLDQKPLDAEVQKELYHFGQAHKDDARPQLLLAWDAMAREWDGIAVRMYRMAYHADKRAKDDPSMLRDLLLIASRFDKVEHTEATEIIQEAYGAQALPQLDGALAELRAEGDLVRAARLQRVRTALGGR